MYRYIEFNNLNRSQILDFQKDILVVSDLQIYGKYRGSWHDANQKYSSNDDSYQVRFIEEEKLDYIINFYLTKKFLSLIHNIYFQN